MTGLPPAPALLLIDVINDFDFPAAGRLLQHALPAARRLARLKRAARAAGIPVIHVNDNFGRWQCSFEEQIDRCLAPGCPGREIARLLRPGRGDYFVLKPRHSGFYSTSLGVLLDFLGVRTLVLAGIAGDICVLYTANDAYMRGYGLVVAHDGIASESAAGNRAALAHMKERLKARSLACSTLCRYLAMAGGEVREVP
jgi:nicotinamidase-related amidase